MVHLWTAVVALLRRSALAREREEWAALAVMVLPAGLVLIPVSRWLPVTPTPLPLPALEWTETAAAVVAPIAERSPLPSLWPC